MSYRAVAVLAALTGIGLFVANAPAGAKPVCRTVYVSTSSESAKVTVTPCERLNVGFEFGTQGQIVPVWQVSTKPATKVLKLFSQGYENTDPTGETTTQFFLFRVVRRGTATVRFRETTASSPEALDTFKLSVTVRRRATTNA
jgi:hypothetical protein